MLILKPFFSITCLLIFSKTRAKVFEKCELARLLEEKHGMTREEIKSWVCIAEYESTFNSSAINHFNSDGSKDHGLFQLNNKYWCSDSFGKNVCGISCEALLDDDLTDDLICIKKIIKDTERWKGKGTGLTAWVAYVNRCQNRDLEAYISDCWSTQVVSNSIDEDGAGDVKSVNHPELDGAFVPVARVPPVPVAPVLKTHYYNLPVMSLWHTPLFMVKPQVYSAQGGAAPTYITPADTRLLRQRARK